jgi:putative Mg2+ transporter-C (MgtC) family protein
MIFIENWKIEFILLGNIILSMLLAGLIGFEREKANKPAGLRTQMIVAAMSVALIDIGSYLLVHYKEIPDHIQITPDPLRLIEAIIVGVSFIGAGTIFRDRDSNHIEGLTTAASLLLSALIGVLIGLDLYITAIGLTLITLLVLRALNRIIKN